jgi:hypothetical protein
VPNSENLRPYSLAKFILASNLSIAQDISAIPCLLLNNSDTIASIGTSYKVTL